jgi:hypothetical protein
VIPALLCVVAAIVIGCGGAGITGQDIERVTQIEAAVQGGQSNASGANVDLNGANSPPFGVPTSAVTLFRRVPVGTDPAVSDTVLQDLQKTVTGTWTYHGAELGMGLALRAGVPAGTRVAILKASAGGSFVTDWIEGGTYNAGLQTAISEFKSLLQTAYPGATIRWHWVWNQGEQEARDATETKALAWAANFATLRTQMQSYTGQSTIRPHIVRTWHSLAGGTWLATVRSQQATAASAASGYLLDIDATIDGAIQTDNIHWTGAGFNNAGKNVIAPSILNDIAAHPDVASNDNCATWPTVYALPPAHERRRRRRRLAA